MGDVHSDAQSDLRERYDFGQYAAEFSAINQAIIRPFQSDRRVLDESGCSVVDGQSGDKTNLCLFVLWCIAGKQQGGIKIAGFRHPDATKAAPARLLLIRHDPNRPTLAVLIKSPRFGVSAVDGVVVEDWYHA